MLRWAIVGTSFISDTMARAIANSPGSVATLVVGRDVARRDAFCARHSIARAVSTVEEAAADPGVDVVYVGTPNHVHHEAVIAAAAGGKAVLSEKSLTVAVDQASALASAVRDRVFFVEGLMYLAHPVIDRFVSVLTDGRLGELKAIDASYAADIAHLVNPEGRGAIFNLGCYPASLVQLVVDAASGNDAFSNRDAVSALGTISNVDGNVCETAAVVRFANGVLATIHTAETYGNTWRFQVQGSNGTLSFVTNPWLPKPDENSFVWRPYDGDAETFVVDDPLDAFDHQVRMVERNLAAGRLEAERPSPRLDDSVALMEFLAHWHDLAIGAHR